MTDRRTSRQRVQYAAFGALQSAARLIPSFVFRLKRLLVVAVATDRQPDDLPGLDLGWATKEDAPSMLGLGYDPEEVRSALEAGPRAVLASHGSLVVGCYWFDPNPHHYEDWLRLAPGSDVVFGEVRVAAEYRGRGIAGALRRFASPRLREAGFNRVVGLISGQNHPSQQAARKGQYEVIGTIRYLRILGLTIVDLSGSWHFGWWGRGRRLEIETPRPHD
ncbi:MAG: GNAT family N-acetyltransferase [Acidimicrobiia bacterium]